MEGRQHITSEKYISVLPNPCAQDEHLLVPTNVPPALDGVAMETSAHGVTDEDNARMQVLWNKKMCEEMNIPEGYLNVGVLIIKWVEKLDQLKSGDEVSKLLVAIAVS